MPPKVWLTANPSIVLIDCHPWEILRCWALAGVVDLDQRLKSTHAVFSHCCVALPLSPNLSLSISLSLLLALFPVRIYLYWFHIKTSWSACFTWEIAYDKKFISKYFDTFKICETERIFKSVGVLAYRIIQRSWLRIPSSRDERKQTKKWPLFYQLKSRGYNYEHSTFILLYGLNYGKKSFAIKHLMLLHSINLYIDKTKILATKTDRHLSERHLSNWHLSNWHLYNWHFSNRRLSDRQLSDKRLSDTHTYTMAYRITTPCLTALMLSAIILGVNANCLYAECCYAECDGALWDDLVSIKKIWQWSDSKITNLFHHGQA
jgi:hypothetical protein